MNRQRRVLAVALATALVGGVAGLVVWNARPTIDQTPAPTPSTTFSLSPQQAVTAAKNAPSQGAAQDTAADAAVAAPDEPAMSTTTMAKGSIWIPSLGAYGRLQAGRIDAGELELPTNPKRLSVWDGGSPPTAAAGTTLISGHVRSNNQPGTLAHLASITPGSTIHTKDTTGHLTQWAVTALGVHEVQKAQLPDWVWAGPAGDRRLVLVTCGGPWLKSGHYRDNVLVTAVPVVQS